MPRGWAPTFARSSGNMANIDGKLARFSAPTHSLVRKFESFAEVKERIKSAPRSRKNKDPDEGKPAGTSRKRWFEIEFFFNMIIFI